MSNIRLEVPRHFKTAVDHPHSEWLFNQAKSQAGQELFVIAMTQGRKNGTWLEIGCGDPIRSNNTYLLEKRFGWTGVSIDTQRMDSDMITPFEEYWSGFYGAIRQPNWPDMPVPPDQLPDGGWRFLPYYQNFIAQQITDIDDIPKDQRSWQTARPGTDFQQADALDFDYDNIPHRCDYLQIDIHPSSSNLALLDRLLPHHRFSVITFEHDAWDHSEESARVRIKSRQLLEAYGYELIISDVTVPPGHGNGIGDEPINFEDWWVDPQQMPEHIWLRYQDLSDHARPKYYYDSLFDLAL